MPDKKKSKSSGEGGSDVSNDSTAQGVSNDSSTGSVPGEEGEAGPLASAVSNDSTTGAKAEATEPEGNPQGVGGQPALQGGDPNAPDSSKR